MALGIVYVDHQLETMRDVDVMRVDILSALLQRLGQVQCGLEDEFFVLHGGVVRSLVLVSDSRVLREVHLGLGDICLVHLTPVAAKIGNLGLLYPLRYRFYQPHLDLPQPNTFSYRRQLDVCHYRGTKHNSVCGNGNAITELVGPDVGVGL